LIAADVNLPPDLLLKVLPKFDYHPAIQTDDIGEIKKSEAFMRSVGIIKATVDIDKFTDVSLERESGIK
jgi:sulfonate transport system substrate-binding protein